MEDNKQEIIQEKFCICCGRPQSMVPLLLEGNFGNICSDCVNQAFNTVREQNEKVSKNLMSGIPKPHEIKKFLDQYIIGQDRVKEKVAVAVYNHYKRISTPIVNDVEIEKSNICIVGPTGTGKCVSGDTKVKVRNKKTGEIYYDTINNLKNMLITNSTKNVRNLDKTKF